MENEQNSLEDKLLSMQAERQTIEQDAAKLLENIDKITNEIAEGDSFITGSVCNLFLMIYNKYIYFNF